MHTGRFTKTSNCRNKRLECYDLWKKIFYEPVNDDIKRI